MEQNNYYIGIDVSKDTLDVCILQGANKQHTLRISNDAQGLTTLGRQLKQWDITPEQTLLCLENTGFYGYPLAHWAVAHQYNTWMADALSIKKSLGLVRGKNDRIDAYRIALYAYRFQDKKQLWQPSNQVLCDLQQLFTTRNRLLRTLNQLKTPLQEGARFLPKKMQKDLQNACNPALKGIEKSLKVTMEAIERHIEKDTQLAGMSEIITSIKGVGPQLATGFIIASHGFQKIRSAEAMACYAGVAPFEHISGTSIRGRNRVSPLANKPLKALLHMSALSAIRHNEELKAYYERKVASGKSKMSVINAVRNKLIARIFACIRDGRKYEKNYTRKVA